MAKSRKTPDTLWQAATTPSSMIDALQMGKFVPEREGRLLGCGFARTAWHLLGDASRTAVETAEAYCDGLVGDDALIAVERAAHAAIHLNGVSRHVGTSAADIAWRTVLPGDVNSLMRVMTYRPVAGTQEEATATLFELMGCVYGNPFREIGLDARHATENVVALARAAYDGRAWETLPILADALEEAGFTDADVLAHLRGGGLHCRGCRAVDAILGKREARR